MIHRSAKEHPAKDGAARIRPCARCNEPIVATHGTNYCAECRKILTGLRAQRTRERRALPYYLKTDPFKQTHGRS